jgi:hypothetical protein
VTKVIGEAIRCAAAGPPFAPAKSGMTKSSAKPPDARQWSRSRPQKAA